MCLIFLVDISIVNEAMDDDGTLDATEKLP